METNKDKEYTNSDKLKTLQKVEIEILDEIVRLCNKHNYDYFLVGGTCLGAIRHKGFIPWDDDIDIAMPREDYQAFIETAIQEIDSKYFVHCTKTDSNYYLGFIKIRKNKTTFLQKNEFDDHTHKGIFVDIFPLDYTDNLDSLKLKINVSLAKNLTETMFYKKKYKKLKELRHPLVSILGLPFSIKNLQKKIDNLMMKQNNKEHKYICSFSGAYHYKKDSFPKDKVYPKSMILFENKKYYTFNDPKWYLNHLYQDYMTLPDENNRLSHNPTKLLFNEGQNLNSLEEMKKNLKEEL